MNCMDRYIGRTVLAATALAWAVVVSLEAVFSFLGELGDIGRGDYDLAAAAGFVLLNIPGRAYQSFPMAVLIGALLGLGNLAAQAELSAFRLAGCSTARLTRSVLQAGLLMVAAVVLLGEGWAPATHRLAKQVRTSAIFNDVSVQRDFGFWVRDGQRFIQVGQSEVDGSLSNLLVFELDATPRLLSASAVSRARYQQDRWLMEDVKESIFSAERVDTRADRHSVWPTLVDPALARLMTRDPQTLSLSELGRYIGYLQRNGSDVASYRLSYWQRWAAPLAVMAMLYLSVSFLLGPLGRYSVGQRVLIGVIVGLLFKLLNETAAHAGLVYGLSPWLSAFLPTLVIIATALLLLRRAP